MHMLATMLVKDIAPIEARHASIRRILTVLSTQTHTLDFADLDSRWIFLQARSRSVDAAPWQTGKFKEKARRKDLSAKAKAKAKRKAPPRHPATRGATRQGGAPRAFIRTRTLGTVGRPDFKQLNADYREAKAANTQEYRRAVRLGKAATQKGRAERKAGGPLRRSSVFGVVGEQIKHRALKQLAVRSCSQMAPDDPAAAAFAMGARAVQAGLSIRECMQVARRVVREAGALAAKQADDDFEVLRKFRSTAGAAAVAQLLQDLPELSQFELVPHAAPHCPVFRVVPPSSQDVTSAISFAHNESSTTNLSAKMADSWEGTHKTIMHECAQQAPVPPPQQTSKCTIAGVCLCTEVGRELASLEGAVEARLKKLCPPHSEHRAALVEGRVVMRLLFEVRDDLDDFDLLMELDSSCTEVFFHISLQYLSPWRSTVHVVKRVDDLRELAVTDTRVYVEAGLSLNRCVPLGGGWGHGSGRVGDGVEMCTQRWLWCVPVTRWCHGARAGV
jgi:hypothetical protein